MINVEERPSSLPLCRATVEFVPKIGGLLVSEKKQVPLFCPTKWLIKKGLFEKIMTFFQ